MAIAHTPPIPFTGGLPLIGQTFEYQRSAFDFYWRIYRRHGEVSRSTLLFRPVYNLLGPDANEKVLLNQAGIFSSKVAWEELLHALFPGGLMLRDGADHRMHRRLMQGAFSHESLQSYHVSMDAAIDRTLDHWPVGQPVLFLDLVKALTLDIATQVFMGEAPGAVANDLKQDFVDMVQASVAIVRLNWPFLSYGKGIAGRQRLIRYFADRVPNKRASQDSDLFARLAQAKDETGQHFSDEDVVNHMIFMMMAAHDTTTSTLSSVARVLAEHPEWQSRLREEMRALPGPLSFADLARMPLADQVMREALRMYSPVPTLPRFATESFEFKGQVIPARSLVALSPLVSHYLPDIWTDPMRFDPERFAPHRAEDRRHRFAWIPFGGGVHKCIGMHFAENQVKLILHHLLRRFEWRLAKNAPGEVKWIPICHPGDALPVVLRKNAQL
ncbi:MAG TPA: cytochrome P450 [Aquabacterium sp.]|nr:cytochrome P450 [Aquabacterium sp.]